MIVDAWKELFRAYDAVIQPAGTGATDAAVLEDAMLIGSFGGFPSITIPDGFVDGLPAALNITGNCYEDEKILDIAYGIESMMDYKGQIAKEVRK